MQISRNFESPLCPDDDTSLCELISAGLAQYVREIETVSGTATKEYILEEALQRMRSEWDDIRFECVPYRQGVAAIHESVPLF